MYKLYNFTQYKYIYIFKKVFHIKKFIKSYIILYDLKNIKVNSFLSCTIENCMKAFQHIISNLYNLKQIYHIIPKIYHFIGI